MTQNGKSKVWGLVALAAALAMALGLAACSGSGSGSGSAAAQDDGPAGVYTGLYTKYVGDSDEYRVTDEPFTLTLEADGTGMHERDDMAFSVTWTLEGEDFRMEEKFLGDPIVYVGTLVGDDLDIFNGDPENDFTCEYVYTKGEPPAPEPEDPMTEFAVNFSADETMAMSTTMACGIYAIVDGRVYGSFNSANGLYAFAYEDFIDDNGNLSTENYYLLDEGCAPNYISVADGYAYYLAAGREKETVNRVYIDGGEPEILVDEQCDYLFKRGDRLYFKDGSGALASCALDGSDKQVLVDKQVAWPYLVDDKWALYQDVDDGQKLHLAYLPTGFDLAITDGPADSPVIDGTTLWYTGDDGSGTRVLHKMDLSAYDPETKTFPVEAGTLPVSRAILAGDGSIYLRTFSPDDIMAETTERWDKLTTSYDGSGAYTSIYSLTSDYLLELGVDADGRGVVFCYKAGSDVGFSL